MILVFLGCIHHSISSVEDTNRAALFLQQEYVQGDFSGSVAIVREGLKIHEGYYPPHPSQIFQPQQINYSLLESFFTSLQVLRAHQRGVLSLDQTLGDFFPDVPQVSSLTIHELLSHRSGVMEIADDDFYHDDELLIIQRSSPRVSKEDHRIHRSNGMFLRTTLSRIEGEPFVDVLMKEEWFSQYIQRESVSRTEKPLQRKEKDIKHSIFSQEQFCDLISALKEGELGVEWSQQVQSYLGLQTHLYGQEEVLQIVEHKEGRMLRVAWFPQRETCVSLVLMEPKNDSVFFEEQLWSALFTEPIKNSTTVQLSSELLASYVGDYKSSSLPVEISIQKRGLRLYARSTGGEWGEVVPTEKGVFSHHLSGIQIRFFAQENAAHLIIEKENERISFIRIQ
jgi:hypothetical protein